MALSTSLKNSLKFILPIVVWCCIYRGLLFGALNVSEDTFAVYAVVKYFLANLKTGIFAHWNPFIHWGMGHICQVGEYNPMWLFTYVLNGLGVSFYHSFLWTVILYMFAGVIGVYYLLLLIFKDRFLAYLGYLFFLFSGFPMIVFTQVTIVLLFVPVVWFLKFLGDFYVSRSVPSVLCMTFCLMLITTTYIPFYFLIVMGVLLVFGVIIFPRVCWNMFTAIKFFVCTKPFVFMLALCSIGAGVGVSFLNWLFLKSNFIVLARPTDVSYDSIKDSGVLISDILRDNSLFSVLIQMLKMPILEHAKSIFTLDTISFDNQRIFYLPIVAHLCVMAGVLAKLNRHFLLWGAVSFTLFLIAITRLSGFYHFLYDHIFFFKMFRNLFILIPFIYVAYIALALEASKGFILRIFDRYSTAKTGIKAAIIMMTMFAAWPVLSAHAQKFALMEHSDLIQRSVSLPLEKPVFSFVRPVSVSDGLKPNDVYRLYNWHMIAMKDADRFITFSYGYPTVWSKQLAALSMNVPQLTAYVQHKFVLYEAPYQPPSFFSPEDFVHWSEVSPPGRFISGASDGLVIDRFNANQLHFTMRNPRGMFFVYNDSYHPYWKVFVNDRPVKLQRVNFAFKGVVLPAGTSHVRFEFDPPGGNALYLGVLLFFYVFFAFCVYLSFRKRV